ncbi:MAG: hypothetical protein HC819_22970 [Cyclobacteriaceae bacterium]|nr:hypothetical protein [Cyclobacteriaceae bacterium]
MLRISMPSDEVRQKYSVLRARLLQLPEVLHVATATTSPGYGVGKNLIDVEDENGQMVERGVDMYGVDFDYISTMGLSLAEGRDFSREMPSDTSKAVIVTEAMARRMGWDEALGKKFSFNVEGAVEPLQVVGVVKDYHHAALYNPIEPLLFYLSENNRILHIKIDGKNIKSTISKVSATWKDIHADQPFDYTFLDQEFEEQYSNDEKRGRIFTIFAMLTMSIACLGLLGLASYTAEQRTKEISIRKVVGAGVPALVYLVSKEFVFLVAISIFIAMPVSYFFMDKWLQNFAFAMEIEWLTFALTGIMALVITFGTVSYHTIRAALANPVNALRDE